MLIVVVMLGIAAAIIIPNMASANDLKVQGALRMIVADITVAQSDAAAFQRPKAVVFRYNNRPSEYVVAEVVNGSVDLATGIIVHRRFGGEQFGLSQITGTNFSNNTLVFDALGGPIVAPNDPTPRATVGEINVTGSNQSWRINVEGFTGRVTIQNMN